MKQTLEEVIQLARDPRQDLDNDLHCNHWYGHSRILKEYAELPPEYGIDAVIEHAPVLAGPLCNIENTLNTPVLFVHSARRAKYLNRRTFKRVIALGNVFSYAKHFLAKEELQREKERLGNTMLVFPAHSTQHLQANSNIGELLSYIESTRSAFDSVQVCLYWADIHRYSSLFLERSIEIVSAGHMFDEMFLSRLKSILDPASYVVTNSLGSHIGYAISMNKRVKFVPTMDAPTSLASGGCSYIYPAEAAHDRRRSKKAAKEEVFGKLLSAFSPDIGCISMEQKEIVENLWGKNLALTPLQLRTVLNETNVYCSSCSLLRSLLISIEVKAKRLYLRILYKLYFTFQSMRILRKKNGSLVYLPLP